MSFHRRMRSFAPDQIQITDEFWSTWHKTLSMAALPHQFQQLVDSGRIANFERVWGANGGTFEGYRFNDSDVYKWQEATAYALKNVDNPKLREQFELTVDVVERTQMADGYVNSYIQNGRLEDRLRNLNALHELYCLGHLIEAGVAAKIYLGHDRLYRIAVRAADFVCDVFGPDKRLGFCGHEEIELALIKLSSCSADNKYRELAHWMIEKRGQRPSIFDAELKDERALSLSPLSAKLMKSTTGYSGEYAQDHAPIREHDAVVGHAVRAMYLYIAATDLADGKNDEELELALTRCWDSLTSKRMYITGGIGPSGENEGFTHDFDLPNSTAYAETCAAIGLAIWGHRMLEQTENADYADTMERAFYNGALSGISLDGTGYFYDNPLESRGNNKRTPWFGCACCPPNIARLIASVGQYAFGISDRSFYIHMPIGAVAKAKIAGQDVKFTLTGTYPWNGTFSLEVNLEEPTSFEVCVRIPEWADEVATEIAGASEEADYRSGYAVFDRTWRDGDVLQVDLEMEPKWIEANPLVRDDIGRVALTRGPLVFCAEEHDLGYAPQLLSVDTEAEPEIGPSKAFPNARSLNVEGEALVADPADSLYMPAGSTSTRATSAAMIPYYLWNNRGPNNMQVWLRQR